jgi:DNA-binding transcriptional ArsR family regulator
MHSEDPDFALPAADQVERATASLRMLSDPTRFRILWCLLQGESSVSQHLAKLRLAQLVTARRDGSYVYYQAHDEHVRRLMGDALQHADEKDLQITA